MSMSTLSGRLDMSSRKCIMALNTTGCCFLTSSTSTWSSATSSVFTSRSLLRVSTVNPWALPLYEPALIKLPASRMYKSTISRASVEIISVSTSLKLCTGSATCSMSSTKVAWAQIASTSASYPGTSINASRNLLPEESMSYISFTSWSKCCSLGVGRIALSIGARCSVIMEVSTLMMAVIMSRQSMCSDPRNILSARARLSSSTSVCFGRTSDLGDSITRLFFVAFFTWNRSSISSKEGSTNRPSASYC
mmetsp:Transcript_6552/g.16815  ORF Transcript_6552/g.16815 Transcript_6552/m.16815 type:complete len:250 (-) Transcript_6552:169-918(-)